MIEFKPKVKNKYNRLISEYVNKIDSKYTEVNKNSEDPIIKTITTNQGIGELKIKVTKNRRNSSKNKLISSRNRNYNNLIISENE